MNNSLFGRRAFSIFYLLTVVLFGIAFSVFAQQGGDIGEPCETTEGCRTGLSCHPIGHFCYAPLGEGPANTGQVFQIIARVSNFLFTVFMSAALIFLVWSALQFVFAGGNTEKINRARDQLLWGVVGLSAALLAAFVDDIIKDLLSIQ